jgi:hypothetical protein
VLCKARREAGETWRRKDGSRWTKLTSGTIVPVPEQRQTGMFGEEQAAPPAERAARKTCTLLANILESGKSATVQHKDLGEIAVDAGHTGKSGYGLRHIIEQRYTKDGKNDVDITALICLVKDAAQHGKVSREITREINGLKVGRYNIEKNGIVAFVSKTRGAAAEKFVITGFTLDDKEEEATGAIQTVIARYGYTPEFSDVRKQVGAVIALLALSHNTVKKSRGQAERVVKSRLKISYKEGKS